MAGAQAEGLLCDRTYMPGDDMQVRRGNRAGGCARLLKLETCRCVCAYACL